MGRPGLPHEFSKMGVLARQCRQEDRRVLVLNGGLGVLRRWYSPGPAPCTWKVAELVKRVSKKKKEESILDNTIYNVVDKVARSQNRSCFKSCDDSGVGRHRNTSSPCWIECFYGTVLGADADHHGGKVAGMPLADLVAAWSLPFASDDTTRGGCPAIKLNPADRR